MSNELKCRISIKKRIYENVLRGKVQLVSKKSIIIQQAFIEITGIANCSFKLNKNYIENWKIYSKNTAVTGFQQFYYTRHALCGGEFAHQHMGNESYKFFCYWPSRLPGTWFGEFGSVKYIAKVTVKLETEEIYTHSQFIFVKFKRNLTTENHLLFEARVDIRRNFASKSAGGVRVSVWIPLCGIAAGQSIPVLCSVKNLSKLHFGSLLFILTRIDIYRSDSPIQAIKQVRTDICRVARMVNIHKGTFDYYSVLKTDSDTIPTSQFYKCTCCQIIYEVWVSLQGAFKRYRRYGYPNVDTPGIPLIIGTQPIKNFNTYEITAEVFKKMYEYNVPIFIDELPEDFKQIIHKTEEELSKEALDNLQRQLEVNEQLLTTINQQQKSTINLDFV